MPSITGTDMRLTVVHNPDTRRPLTADDLTPEQRARLIYATRLAYDTRTAAMNDSEVLVMALDWVNSLRTPPPAAARNLGRLLGELAVYNPPPAPADDREWYDVMRDERKARHQGWFEQNMAVLCASGLVFRDRTSEPTPVCLFREPGKPAVNFYPTTGRWYLPEKHRTMTGGAEAFLQWYGKQGRR